MKKVRTTEFWADGRYLGPGRVYSNPRLGNSEFPFGIIYVCPRCGDAWGKVRVSLTRFYPRARMCTEHGGGFLMPFDTSFFEFPRAMLKREISLIVSYEGDYDIALLTGGAA